MANPRQRRKSRSSSYKPVRSTSSRSLRKKPPIKGPQVLQKAWDKTKTVRQNYAALGLLANSNAASNPTEIETDKELPTSHQATVSSQDSTTQPTPQLAAAASTKPSLPKGKGRLIRDSTGAVIGVDLPEDDESDAVNSNERTVRREKDEDTPWGAPMTEDRPIVPVTAKTSVVRELEEMSAAAQGKKKARTASEHQVKWLQELVAAHGDDVEAMARDRRRNVWQKTTGEIRRGIMMAGGSTVLLRGIGT